MNEQKNQTEEPKDRHPLVTLGFLTAGTQLGTALIMRMGRHPVILFGMGLTVGIYASKNRKQILQEAQHLGNQSKKFLSRKSESD